MLFKYEDDHQDDPPPDSDVDSDHEFLQSIQSGAPIPDVVEDSPTEEGLAPLKHGEDTKNEEQRLKKVQQQKKKRKALDDLQSDDSLPDIDVKKPKPVDLFANEFPNIDLDRTPPEKMDVDNIDTTNVPLPAEVCASVLYLCNKSKSYTCTQSINYDLPLATHLLFYLVATRITFTYKLGITLCMLQRDAAYGMGMTSDVEEDDEPPTKRQKKSGTGATHSTKAENLPDDERKLMIYLLL